MVSWVLFSHVGLGSGFSYQYMPHGIPHLPLCALAVRGDEMSGVGGRMEVD